KKNNLKVGDKIKVKSNLFDADNEKGANETVEVEIKGLFDGHNNGVVSAPQELYENTLITDINTAAKVYGNTEDTAVYQDATFFVKGDKNLEKVIKDIGKLDINWREYNLIKSSSNYPALQQSISGIYSIANKLFAGSLIFAGVVVSLLLFLWINARKKEIAVLLSLGTSKLTIFGQFLIELIFISIPAFIGSYFLASYTGDKLGNNILNRVTGDIAKQIAKQSSSSQLGGGAEIDGFNKTLTSLDINILPKSMMYVILFMSLVLIISLIISSSSILKKNPKELLIDND
ncbi:ABC transporter permease, partial [Clostridium perfringens]